MAADLVLFRRWKNTGDVIALFPKISTGIDGRNYLSYEHVGQHGPLIFMSSFDQ